MCVEFYSLSLDKQRKHHPFVSSLYEKQGKGQIKPLKFLSQ